VTKPKLIIHGGLGTAAGYEQRKDRERESLKQIADAALNFLQQHTALETVVYAVSMLEDDPLFNAGTGSKLQSDGVIRMTASVMDGYSQCFAGVINISDVKNPVQIAASLLNYNDAVLAGEEALIFARKNGFPFYNPEIYTCRNAYEKKLVGSTGTVGCVAIDAEGHLAAATSTGGKGFEIPGRVSDSATVAGNYANRFACVSCTGIGEDIVNSALAARIVIRTTDGMELSEACSKSVEELAELGGKAGVIAISASGDMYQDATDPHLSYVMHDGQMTVFP
jgi:L-asparaginase